MGGLAMTVPLLCITVPVLLATEEDPPCLPSRDHANYLDPGLLLMAGVLLSLTGSFSGKLLVLSALTNQIPPDPSLHHPPMNARLSQDLQLDPNVFSRSDSLAPPTRSAPTHTQMMDVHGAPPRRTGGEGTSGDVDTTEPVEVHVRQRSKLIITATTTANMADWKIHIL